MKFIKIHKRRWIDGPNLTEKAIDCIDTACHIYNAVTSVGHQILGVGIAQQSVLDKYNKLTGKKIALRRALKAAKIDNKAVRAQVWEVFKDEFGHLMKGRK